MGCLKLIFSLAISWACVADGAAVPLSISVYATAGDVQKYLLTPETRGKVLPLLAKLNVSRVFLEGRRGDEYVPTEILAEVRDALAAQGIRSAGGIATVPGQTFGVRQTGGLAWLDWESEQTRGDVAAFYAQNANVFDELILDDFYCTGDVSAQADRARAGRSWSAYRRDLLVSLVSPLMRRPAQKVRPNAKLIIKFPQWYDRFHLFGYDPPRMSEMFDQVWVGTEVRNPHTRRMGYVQPTQGYMNFLWLKSIAGSKTVGAWFDHIECNAFQFVDQAYISVLAGAKELTLFRLDDIANQHPGDVLLGERLGELIELAKQVDESQPDGLHFYKPANSDPDENMFIMDYLGMLGLPIVPVAVYPHQSRGVILAAHATCDPNIHLHMHRHLNRGATVIVTPAFVRRAGSWASTLAGVTCQGRSDTAYLPLKDSAGSLVPLEIDSSVIATSAETSLEVHCNGRSVPLLTKRRVGAGNLLVLNMRTFSDADYRGTGEWLLPPKQIGWLQVPQRFLDQLRARMFEQSHAQFEAPPGVVLCQRGKNWFIYNTTDETVRVRVRSREFTLPPHEGFVHRAK